jgi:hypothetical protein
MQAESRIRSVVRSVLVGFYSKLVKFAVRFHYSNNDKLAFNIDLEDSPTSEDVFCFFREARAWLGFGLWLFFQDFLDSIVEADHSFIVSVQFSRLFPGRQVPAFPTLVFHTVLK